MSILIKGMEMPEGSDVLTIAITSGGEVLSIGFDNTIDGGIFLSYPSNYPIEAVPVPPHGRLIDADALLGHMKKIHDKWKMEGNYTPTTIDEIMVMNMPTIIEAEDE